MIKLTLWCIQWCTAVTWYTILYKLKLIRSTWMLQMHWHLIGTTASVITAVLHWLRDSPYFGANLIIFIIIIIYICHSYVYYYACALWRPYHISYPDGTLWKKKKKVPILTTAYRWLSATVVTPVRQQWSYCSLALSHPYMSYYHTTSIA